MFPYNNSGTKYLLTDYVDQTGNTSHVGLYDSSGMINVTILESEDIFTGLYASNGSVNVVEGAGLGIYSPCGAYNVEQGGVVPIFPPYPAPSGYEWAFVMENGNQVVENGNRIIELKRAA